MVPLIELRGAIPVSQAFTPPLPLLTSYIVCVIGNMLPVPIIYLFARRFLEWGKDRRFIGSVCRFFLVRGAKAGEKLKSNRGFFIALTLFVGIPLPGTGAWTGTLAASLLDAPFKKTVLACTAGVFLAGVIMALLSFGAFNAIR